MIYFSSDFHFGHDKSFIWQERGYSSCEEMNHVQVWKWNSKVKETDEGYILGDLVLGSMDNLKYIDQLNGKLHIILGNHDTDARAEAYKSLPNVVEVVQAARLKYNNYSFYLSHYPAITGTGDKKPKETVLNLYGHTHQKDFFYKDNWWMYHVGIDAHQEPVLIDDVIADISAAAGLAKNMSGRVEEDKSRCRSCACAFLCTCTGDREGTCKSYQLTLQ